MGMKFIVGPLVICLCGLLLACGSLSGSGDAVAFNNSIAGANSKCDEAIKKISDHELGALSGNAGELTTFKKVIAEAKQSVAAARVEVQGLKVPSKQSSKDFYTAELKYLDMREQNVADFSEMVRILEDKTTGLAAKTTKLRQLEDKVIADEKRELDALHLAQNAFAKDHNMVILPK